MFYIDNDSGVTVMPPVSAQRSANRSLVFRR
ncbi:Mu prophage; Tail fiber protein [Escherichia coli]|nr:Mu prophage; Tail fiber protein [Escherichia coli]